MAANEQIKQMKASLNDAIIASNAPPEENYNGPDKDGMVALVKSKWAQSGVKGDVLKTGINSTAWKRDTRWQWLNAAWYKTDVSKAQGFIVVKSDDKIASIYYINLSKDHTTQDKVAASYFDDLKAEPDVSRKVLLTNVK